MIVFEIDIQLGFEIATGRVGRGPFGGCTAVCAAADSVGSCDIRVTVDRGGPAATSAPATVARGPAACSCSVTVRMTLRGPPVRLQAAIRARLNPLFKVARVVVKDALPRTASNKLMRRVLRGEAAPADVQAASKL